MTAIVGADGKPVIVLATVGDGPAIALATTEALSEFFASFPHARLEFVPVKDSTPKRKRRMIR
jgi:phosphoketolase